MTLSGKELSNKIKENIKFEISKYSETHRPPCLVAILVGDNPASKVYVANKEKACNEVGIRSEIIRVSEDTSEEVLLRIIDICNKDNEIDGILVQLPLPKHINADKVISAIDPNKDVDGFHPENVAKLWMGHDCIKPCTPQGIIALIDSANIELKGKNVVVIGRSNIVGLPIAKMCLDRNATVTICHSKTENLKEITRSADVLIVAIGKPKFITHDMVRPDTVVIDVGINRDEKGKLCGDVDYDLVSLKTNLITPVPGGVGPMTICELLNNTLFCYLRNIN
jgi:methylenetetrahydrofolate dehydrogenase (NADP+)/methenyltetrahydrofolate cyclohydrolase